MKKNSLTSKKIGDPVVTGDFLGIAGSSGSSSGPHLHFEVWSGSTNTTYKDPYSGPCNLLNSTSYWVSQKKYRDPTVIKVSSNTTDIVIPGCPTTETPNESSSFLVPFQGPGLSPGYAKFYLFIRDDSAGFNADCKILNPNGSTFNSWTYSSTANNKNYIIGYSKKLPLTTGTYTFQVVYNGKTCSKTFNITTATSVKEFNQNAYMEVYPNPAKDMLTVSSNLFENEIPELSIYNRTGQIIPFTKQTKVTTNFQMEIQLNELPAGIYFIRLSGVQQSIYQKFMVE